MTFFVIIILVFIISTAATKFHRKWINEMAYYNQKLITIKDNSLELEETKIGILNITKQYRESRSEIVFPCARIPGAECSLCDKECLFRRTDVDDK